MDKQSFCTRGGNRTRTLLQEPDFEPAWWQTGPAPYLYISVAELKIKPELPKLFHQLFYILVLPIEQNTL